MDTSKVDGVIKNISNSRRRMMKMSSSHEDIKHQTQEAYNFNEIKRNYDKLREKGVKSGLDNFDYNKNSVKKYF